MASDPERAALIARLERAHAIYADEDSPLDDQDTAGELVMRALPDVLAALRDDGWRPIATAPRDGSYVLLFRDKHCVIGYWDNELLELANAPTCEAVDGGAP